MKERGLYEVLYRFDLGAFAGAHVIQIERFTDDDTGDVVAEKLLPAEAVTVERASELIGGQMAALLAQVSDLQGKAAEADARADSAEASAARDQAYAAELLAASAEKSEEMSRISLAMLEAQAHVAALEVLIEEMKSAASASDPAPADGGEAQAA